MSAPRWLLPYGLVGRPWEYPFAGGSAAVLILIFLAEVATPTAVEVTTLGLLPVVAAVWLLSTPVAVAVAVTGIGLIAIGWVSGGLHPITAAAEASIYAALAIAIRVYAAQLVALLHGSAAARPGSPTVLGLESLARLVESSMDGMAAIDEQGKILYVNGAVGSILGLSQRSMLGVRFSRFVVGDQQHLTSYITDTALDRAGRVTVAVLRSDGAVRELEVTHTPISFDRRRVVAAILRDTTEANRLQRTAAALVQTATSMAVTQPIERMLEALAQSVVEATDALAAGVFLLDGERSLRTAGTCGLPSDYIEAMDAATELGARRPAIEAVQKQRDIVEEDLPARILSDDRFAPAHSVVRDVDWKFVLTTPMLMWGRPLGALSVYFVADYRPTESTVTFLHAIAGLAASAAESARLVSALQDQVAMEERQRLSRELHDSVSQALYGIVLGVRSAQKRLARDPDEVREPLDYVLSLAEAALADMRSLILALRPDSLEREGLIGALSKRAEAVKARYGIEVTEQLPEEPAIPPELKLAIYRTAQEAIHNVVKHSSAKRISLVLKVSQDSVTMEVKDDGRGFNPTGPFPEHLGIETMRERAEVWGGVLQIDSTPGEGTCVRVQVPLPPVRAST